MEQEEGRYVGRGGICVWVGRGLCVGRGGACVWGGEGSYVGRCVEHGSMVFQVDDGSLV